MSSEYGDEDFEPEEAAPPPPAPVAQEAPHQVRLNVDLHSVRDFISSATFTAFYDLSLSPSLLFSFKSKPTTVRKGSAAKIASGFAEFPFVLSKTELYAVISEAKLVVKLGQQGSDGLCTESVGEASFPLENVLRADLKKVRNLSSRPAFQLLEYLTSG